MDKAPGRAVLSAPNPARDGRPGTAFPLRIVWPGKNAPEGGWRDAFGGKVSTKLNDQEFKRTYGSTGSWQATINKPVGYFGHGGGPVDIDLAILRQNGENQALIDLHALTLEKQ